MIFLSGFRFSTEYNLAVHGDFLEELKMRGVSTERYILDIFYFFRQNDETCTRFVTKKHLPDAGNLENFGKLKQQTLIKLLFIFRFG